MHRRRKKSAFRRPDGRCPQVVRKRRETESAGLGSEFAVCPVGFAVRGSAHVRERAGSPAGSTRRIIAAGAPVVAHRAALCRIAGHRGSHRCRCACVLFVFARVGGYDGILRRQAAAAEPTTSKRNRWQCREIPWTPKMATRCIRSTATAQACVRQFLTRRPRAWMRPPS